MIALESKKMDVDVSLCQLMQVGDDLSVHKRLGNIVIADVQGRSLHNEALLGSHPVAAARGAFRSRKFGYFGCAGSAGRKGLMSLFKSPLPGSRETQPEHERGIFELDMPRTRRHSPV